MQTTPRLLRRRPAAAAFMGAALSMLGDRAWQDILRREDPQGFQAAKQ